MPDDGSALPKVERWLSTLASVAAPLSLVTAVLFYFGYAASRAEYRYFGVDVDTIGLSTQHYVMRSPQVLLTPVLLLLAVGVLGVGGRTAVARQVAAVMADQQDGAVPDVRASRYLRVVRRVARVLMVAGYCALGAGAVLVASYLALRGWAYFTLVTPLLLTVGAASVLYGHGLGRLPHPRDRPGGPASLALWLVLATSVFWSTATVAEASGRGLAHDLARDLDRLPGVILDTTERLYLSPDDAVRESALGEHPGQTYRYRYRDLRLLVHGGDRLFLVPDTWSAGNSTLVVPLDDAVRVQFQFVNDPP